MSVMLTKFESKSNRVKGMLLHFSVILYPNLCDQVLHSTLLSLCLPLLSIMAAFNCGTTAWAYWSTVLKNTKVRMLSLAAGRL